LVVGTSALNTENNAYGLDPATGKVRWRTRVPGAVVAATVGGTEVYLVSTALVSMSNGMLLQALDPATGHVRWAVALALAWTARTFAADDRGPSLALPDGTIAAYGAATGAVRWRRHVGGDGTLTRASAAGGLVVVAPDVRSSPAIALSAATGAVVWRSP